MMENATMEDTKGIGIGLLIIAVVAAWYFLKVKAETPEEQLARLRAELEAAYGAERERLLAKIAEVETVLAEIAKVEAALAEMPAGGYKTVAELEAVTGEKVVDIYDWNRLNFLNPIIVTSETTYTGVSPTVNYSAAVKAAAEQAKSTGSPTYVSEGGYYVDAGGSYIKGAGW